MNHGFGIGQRVFFIALILGTTALFLWMVRDYLFPVFWAIVFALLLHPFYTRLQKRFSRTLAAALTILVALIVIVLPVSWLGTQIAQEAYALYRTLAESGTLSSFALPEPAADLLGMFGYDAEHIKTDIATWASTASAWIFSEALAISSATFTVIVKTLFMLYLLFFFLRDGEALGRYLMRHLPLGDKKESVLFARFASTTRALMKGTIVVALVQGLIGGILFWIAGVPNPILWGAVMAFASVIPAVGPFIVWLPAGLFLLAIGSLIPALIVLIGGAVVLSSVDNFLRPMLVGRETEMPDALIFISILGGIGVFGIAGIIIGPVIAALVLTVWDLFAEEFEKELTAQG